MGKILFSLLVMRNFVDNLFYLMALNERDSLYMVQNFKIARNIGNIAKPAPRLFSPGTQQSNTSERERNRNLTDLYTQMWIEIGQSEKR